MFNGLPAINTVKQWLYIFYNLDQNTLKKVAFDFLYFDDCWNFEDGSINKTEGYLKAVYSWIKYAFFQTKSGCGGIPSYFDLAKQRYLKPSPKTTGFLIPTLLEINKKFP